MDAIVLNPEITFTAIGASAGILLTVTTQTLTGLLQRRSDRVLKTYETRLDVFTEFVFTAQAISEAGAWIKKIQEDEDLQQFLNWKATVATATDDADRITNELNAHPPPPPDRATQLRAEAREKAERLNDAMAAISRAGPAVKKLEAEVTTRSVKIDELRTQFKKLSFKVQLIATDRGINKSLEKIGNRLENMEALTPADYSQLMKAAARQIGIRR